jgi:hypothetical protein
MKSTKYHGIDITRDDLLKAFNHFDTHERHSFPENRWRKYVVIKAGKRYPPKEVLRIALHRREPVDGGGMSIARIYENLGFDVIPIQPEPGTKKSQNKKEREKTTDEKSLIHISKNSPIKTKEFDNFLSEFSKGKPLNSIKLCNRIKNDWIVTNNREWAKVYLSELPSGTGLRKNIPAKLGIYAIYGRHPSNKKDGIKCFYVGVSSNENGGISQRIIQHLHGDIVKNYGSCFTWLKECTEVYIFYSTLDYPTNNIMRKLEILESCLNICLRPKFISDAASV